MSQLRGGGPALRLVPCGGIRLDAENARASGLGAWWGQVRTARKLTEEREGDAATILIYSRSGFDAGSAKLAQAEPDRCKLFTPSDLFG